MPESLRPEILDKLDEKYREKLSYFARLLISQSKYRRLQQEVLERKHEIKKGETLTHQEILDKVDV